MLLDMLVLFLLLKSFFLKISSETPGDYTSVQCNTLWSPDAVSISAEDKWSADVFALTNTDSYWTDLFL